MLDYLDGQIPTERETRDDQSTKGIMEVQKAFKNRMTKIKSGTSGYLLGERKVVSVMEHRNEDSPESYRDHNMSRHRIQGSTTSLDTIKQNAAMAQVNKLNKPLQKKLQLNATTLGKRFVHKSVQRQASKSVN